MSGLYAHGIRFAWPKPSTMLLDDLELAVAPGECVAVLGPSGSGKSTLLRILAGLEAPVSGTVSWGGERLDGVPVHRRRFVLMAQEPALFPHLDVTGNVTFGLRYRQDLAPTRQEAHHLAEQWLDRVGLGGLGARSVNELSGGQRQRVALARSLIVHPRAVLLDEPLSALDRDLRDRLATETRDVLVAARVAAVWVTHDRDEARRVGDRVLRLEAGRLVSMTAEELGR